MNFLYPLGLFALGAWLLPIFVHRWREARKVVQIGSIRFLDTTLRTRLRSSRWTQRLLLACRILLLGCLALCLAQANWSTHSRPVVNWALRERGLRLPPEITARWNSLARGGFSQRELAADFPPFVDGAVAGEESPQPDIWSLVREADARAGPDSHFVVFVPGRLAQLKGSRPENLQGEWEFVQVKAPMDDTEIASATRKLDGVITVVVRRVTDHATLFQTVSRHEASADASIQPGDLINWDFANSRVRLHSSVESPWVTISPAHELKLIVNAPVSRVQDERKILAAGAAIAAKHGWDYSGARNLPPEKWHPDDWVFLLEPTPDENSAIHVTTIKGVNIIAEPPAGAAIIDTDAHLRLGRETDESAWLLPEVRLTKEASQSIDGSTVLWRDSFGRALLTAAGTEARSYHLATRFSPDWSDLGSDAAISAWLERLIAPGQIDFREPDRRTADVAQFTPNTRRLVSESFALPRMIDLAPWFAGVTLLLFALERWLSSRASAPLPTSVPTA